jgi:hypothetical protein
MSRLTDGLAALDRLPDLPINFAGANPRLFEIVTLTEHTCVVRYDGIELRFRVLLEGVWEFDEIVGEVSIHGESMDTGLYWIGVQSAPRSDHRVCLDLTAKRKNDLRITGWVE